MLFRISNWDISAILKGFLLLSAGWFYLVIHILILIMSYTLNVSISIGVDLETALTPLHSAIMSDDWLSAYFLMRDNVLSEIPFYSLFEKLFIRRSNLSYDSLLYDFVKACLCGSISYLLCRFNLLLSSKKHPVVFSAVTYLWTSISMFGSMILISFIKTFHADVKNALCIGIVLCSLLLVSTLSYLNLHRIMSFSKIFLKNIVVMLMGVLDALYYYLVSCFIFDFLHNHVSDKFILTMLVMGTSVFAGLFYSFIKDKLLS